MKMNESQKPKTKKQHFIPVFLLKNFCNSKGLLTVYDKQTGRTFETSPKDICYKEYLYEPKLTETCFASPNEFENAFSKKETQWARLIRKIIANCDNPRNEKAFVATKEEKAVLAEFFYNLYARNPYSMEKMSSLVEENGLHEPFRFYAKMGLGEEEHLFKMVDLLVSFKHPIYLEQCCKELSEMFFYIGKAEETPFVLSDYPFLNGENNEKIFSILPISPKYILMWIPQKIGTISNVQAIFGDSLPQKMRNYFLKNPNVRFIFSTTDS